MLPCCLSREQEKAGLALTLPVSRAGDPLRVLFIGRLNSYKRLDFLLHALATLDSPWQLSVVGDGPNRLRFQQLTMSLSLETSRVVFHGKLSESAKLAQIAASDVLVLPSESSNEAFGIVQLEAMAAGRISLAFDQPRSGMGWVGQLPGLSWSQSPEGLVQVLQRLADQPQLRHRMSLRARERYNSLFARSVWLERLSMFGKQLKTGKVPFTE